MPKQNYIKEWLEQNERSIKWLSRQIGVGYDYFYKYVTNMNNEELYDKFTLREFDQIEKIIPNIKEKIRQH